MKICMVVCNDLTTDNRVLREAQTLQAAGHDVSLVGMIKDGPEKRSEILPDGVRLYRVDWRARAYLRLIVRAIPWILVPLLAAAVLLAMSPGMFRAIATFFAALPRDVAHGLHAVSREAGPFQLRVFLEGALVVAAALMLGGLVVLLRRRSSARAADGKIRAMLRYADALAAQDRAKLSAFPPPRSRIPEWISPRAIDALAVPLALLGRPFAQFALSNERVRQMADFVVALAPDVIHAHDCTALPIAALVKKALGIPVVYDAHEIYAEAAVKRRGVIDYYILLHRQYLPIVDRFITVNQSIAQYYRHAHPQLSPAVVIRNAASRFPDSVYDGRLHAAAGLPRSEKILLYQGGFSARRGLEDLVRSARFLPDGWTLVMMGWGPVEQELRRLSAEDNDGRAEGASRIRFIPGAPRLEVLQWSAGASLGIIPYEGTVLNHWFCTPNKLWEFPSAGVPLLVQPFPELRKVVEQYHCGWLLPVVSTPATLGDIVRNLTDEQLRQAREGCRRFISDDAWETAYAPPLIALYEQLAQQSGLNRINANEAGTIVSRRSA